ncbi:hypothetical protein BDM02DRAFT_3112931 [Thelephora ganbajun]|uniref:Uncharacterized protein n=1 Tax=Thelephora ganbajun TaxID=370292 RepID=A0ACB6ZK46_THEGA|nr:hypothetical protein BDM02DRAFT_3112931 [Thelephora ganbajun]
MFAKIVVFFALVAFVNSMPIAGDSTDKRVKPLPPTPQGVKPLPPIPQGVRPLPPVPITPKPRPIISRPPIPKPLPVPPKNPRRGTRSVSRIPTKMNPPGGRYKIQPIADAIWKREFSLDIDTDVDVEILKSPPATTRPPPPPHRTGGGKGPVELDLDFDAGINAVHPKRNFLSKLSHGLTGRDVANNSIEARGIKDFFKKLGKVLSGRDVVDKQILARGFGFRDAFKEIEVLLSSLGGANRRVTARSVVIDPELLAELQALVNITTTLLRAEGKDSSVNVFVSQIDTLKSKVESGSVPADDLVNAADEIASSYV